MVRIRSAKIGGLYSYGNEKSRIDFGQKTVVVGTNDSGKSSIFKALNFFLKCLTDFNSACLKPWDQQDTHEMTVGLALNDAERRHTAEILSVVNTRDGLRISLAPDAVAEWLASRLERVELTISWRDSLFQLGSSHIRYALRLEDLGVTVCSTGYNQDTWALESPRFSTKHEPDAALFSDVIAGMLGSDSVGEGLGARLGQGARISEFPIITRLDSAEATARYRNRVESVAEVSGDRTRHNPYSFFIMFGHMLERGFVFVSEQRMFQESNDLERLPLKDNGSNLQSCLFWLQNGNKDEQDACSAIQRMFGEVLVLQNLSFVVSATEREEVPDTDALDRPRRKVYPGRTIVRFAKTLGREQRFMDFMSVGAGVRETLFLLAMCFEK